MWVNEKYCNPGFNGDHMRLLTIVSALCLTSFCEAQNNYVLTADSKTKDQVKYGEHIYAVFPASRIFPGTIRNVDIYVPEAYDGKTPATVCVFQDGMLYNADTVVSNLIAAKEIPVMLLVAASPGRVIGDYDAESARENRTYEYDTPSPQFGEFLLNELFPFIETLQTKSGKKIILSRNRDDRMIAGCSSGAACAFNVAWYTDAFSRVYSSCGSYTGLRGSFVSNTLVNKFETKPIRFFLQSGSRDMWTSFGDWWAANQTMARALEFAGYDFTYRFTEQAQHCDGDGTVVFPEVLRFLWKGYPGNKPFPVQPTRNLMLSQILPDNKQFEQVAEGIGSAKLLADNTGNVLIARVGSTHMLDTSGRQGGPLSDVEILSIGHAGERLLFDSVKMRLRVITAGGTVRTINKQIMATGAVALRDGGFYVVGKSGNSHLSTIWYLSEKYQLSEKAIAANLIGSIALSGNNNWLYAFDYHTRRGYSYKVDRNNKDILFKQEFFSIHIPDQFDAAETLSAITDDAGRTYLATNLGIQICDYNGRCEGILSLPGNIRPVSLAWGGAALNWLYVLDDSGRIYRRQLHVKGSSPASPMPAIRVGAG